MWIRSVEQLECMPREYELQTATQSETDSESSQDSKGLLIVFHLFRLFLLEC